MQGHWLWHEPRNFLALGEFQHEFPLGFLQPHLVEGMGFSRRRHGGDLWVELCRGSSASRTRSWSPGMTGISILVGIFRRVDTSLTVDWSHVVGDVGRKSMVRTGHQDSEYKDEEDKFVVPQMAPMKKHESLTTGLGLIKDK